jgi:hypothetical protein
MNPFGVPTGFMHTDLKIRLDDGGPAILGENFYPPIIKVQNKIEKYFS